MRKRNGKLNRARNAFRVGVRQAKRVISGKTYLTDASDKVEREMRRKRTER